MFGKVADVRAVEWGGIWLEGQFGAGRCRVLVLLIFPYFQAMMVE
jgi:hypothetical protein